MITHDPDRRGKTRTESTGLVRRFFHYFTQLFLPSILILSVSYLSLFTLPIMEVCFKIYKCHCHPPFSQRHNTRMAMCTFNITLLITLILYAYRFEKVVEKLWSEV